MSLSAARLMAINWRTRLMGFFLAMSNAGCGGKKTTFYFSWAGGLLFLDFGSDILPLSSSSVVILVAFESDRNGQMFIFIFQPCCF